MNNEEVVNRLEYTSTLYPFPPAELERLRSRRWILNRLKKRSIGAEVGVFRGHFSEAICEIVQPRKLYLIDPWSRNGEFFGWGGEYTCNNTLPTAVAKEEARLRTSRFPDTEVVILDEAFPGCLSEIRDKLDWVYLDASHHYDATLTELRALDAVLSHEALILGDDWNPNPNATHHGVFKAVQVFTRTTSWRIVAAGPGKQWCLRKYSEIGL